MSCARVANGHGHGHCVNLTQQRLAVEVEVRTCHHMQGRAHMLLYLLLYTNVRFVDLFCGVAKHFSG